MNFIPGGSKAKRFAFELLSIIEWNDYGIKEVRKTMRYAVVSDVHANLEAFEAVLEQIDRIEVDKIVSLGDLVGYNANPNECVKIVVERDIPTLMGNHDAAASGLEDPVDFNPIAKDAILWTREVLQGEYREFLSRQPEQRSLSGSVRLVHGSMLDRDHYLQTQYDFLENVRRMQEEKPQVRVLFYGHTHSQMALSCRDEALSVVRSPRFRLEEENLYLINPGSVGQPRDRDPRTSFLLYDDESDTVEFIRIPYNITACARKILSAGLPRELADRLSQGW